jgi:nicotinamidase-related amidase
MAKKRERAKRSLTQILEAARANRYKVIHERNLLILALAKHAGFDAHLVPTGNNETGNWKQVLCLHTPAGQIHWKLSPKDVADFEEFLKTSRKSDWDGATATQKGERLENLHLLPCELAARLEASEKLIRELEDHLAADPAKEPR